ncbi:MAG TPA: hypothetical protein VG293_11125 [Solirubrobacteraceae bacterium]|nr:hypothetical protein [Solirubrobacteraceae bacterium]
MPDYAVTRLEEIEEIEGRCPFRPVRHHFGITTFGANVMTARADGDRLINEHSESEPESGEELYFVISGHAEFELNGERHDAPARTLIHARPGVTRTAFAREAGTTVFVVGGAREGQPYAPTGWEVFSPLLPLLESGDYEEGADRAAELVASNPPAGGMLYNTACFESLAGRKELALEHLRQAVGLQPHLAEMAHKDDDFAALQSEPAFTEIVGA